MSYDHSMTKAQLEELLLRGTVKLVFRKKTDNSLRTMLATRHPGTMPAAPDKPSARPMPATHVLVWDTEANGLRSLDMESLTERPELVYEFGVD